MNDPHDTAHDAPHEGPIKTPKQLIAAVAASFIIPILIIILLANYVDFGTKPAAGSDGLGAEAVARRLQPVGQVEVRDASAPRVLRAAEVVYNGQCAACHNSGAAGAPKLGDKAAWAPRIAQGADTLHTHALQGFQGKGGYMPPKGGRTDLSDQSVINAVDYMVSASQ